MGSENLVSITIPPADKTAIEGALNTLKEKLQPFLIALTADEKRALPKVNDKSIPFMEKTLSYLNTNPKFAPAYIDAAELAKDVTASGTLLGFLRPLQQLISELDDTIAEATGEAYISCLAYYQSVRRATEIGVLEAKPIYDDLSKRFPQGGRKPKNGQPA